MNSYMFEFKHPAEGYLTLMRHQGTLVLKCHWPFDLDTNEWIDIQNSFIWRDYTEAVDNALLDGEGEADGIDGGFLKISRRSDAFRLVFSNAEEAWAAKSLELAINRPLHELRMPEE